MSYQFIIDGVPVLTGDLFTGILIIAGILVVFSLIANMFFRRIQESERMKYEFITIIAHKFRTPLTTIKWILENSVNSETDPIIKESFTDMKESNEKLIALTGTLIELTNLDNETTAGYNLQKVILCEYVKQVADNHKDFFHEKNIFFTVQCADPQLMAHIDVARMEFVLQTLFENACNYTPPGRNVDVVVARKGRKALIAVTDHGIGIEKTDLPKLFTKFYRAENARQVDTEGFGVGLFLAQAIVRHHRGRIVAYSAGKDQGSTFTVVLPRAH